MAEASFPLTTLSETQRAQALERFTIIRPALVTYEQLILYCTLPTNGQVVPLEIPPPKPGVSITQPHLPQQMAQGASVTIELDAQILKDSTPPYDFAWTNDLPPFPSQRQQQERDRRRSPQPISRSSTCSDKSPRLRLLRSICLREKNSSPRPKRPFPQGCQVPALYLGEKAVLWDP